MDKEIQKVNTHENKENKKNVKKDIAEDAILDVAINDTVQLYGAAAREHIVAYNGYDAQTGEILTRNLKDIAKSKVNPDYTDSNIKQQAGFSAEVKTKARENAEKILKGKNGKTVRTDDIKEPQKYGNGQIGGTNDQLYDLAEVDKNGFVIDDSARQLKYVGSDSKSCTNKLMSKNYDKYRDANAKIEIPKDHYDGVKEQLAKNRTSAQKSLDKAIQKGDKELIKKYQDKIKRIDDTDRLLKKGKLTSKEAIEARTNPLKSTIKDINKLSNKAGLEGAGIGAAIGGGISIVQNVVAVVKGDEEASEAIISVTKDTTKAAASGYATAYMSTAVKAAMSNAPQKFLQNLSKTNLPVVIVSSGIELGKTLTKYAKGDIDGTECLTELGEKGTGLLASSLGATIGQTLIPIPVVGGLIGGMIGYAMSSAYYNELIGSLNQAKLSHEYRLQVEAECEEAIKAIRQYRLEIEKITNEYLKENISVFNEAFSEMEIAFNTGDIDGFISSTNKITYQLGDKPIFENMNELDELMNSNETIRM